MIQCSVVVTCPKAETGQRAIEKSMDSKWMARLRADGLVWRALRREIS